MKRDEEQRIEPMVRRQAVQGQGTLEIHRLGPHPVIQQFLERLEVPRILDKHIHSNRTGTLSHGGAIGVLIHNILVSRDPLYRLPEWVEQLDAEGLGLTIEQKQAVNDDRMGRALEQLAKYGGRGVFFELALRSIEQFKLETSRVHFDTTSISFQGEYQASKKSPRICKGHSKDHRPDLKQLVFGLNVTSDGAVPLSHQVYSGNQTDDTVHRDNLDALRDLLDRDDFVYVADSKLCTRDNLKHIVDFGGKFVTVMPRIWKQSSDFRERLRKKAARWRTILTVESSRHGAGLETYSTCRGPTKTEDGFRIIWIKSSQKARSDREAREKRLEKAIAALKDLSGRINRRNLKTQKQIRAAIDGILKRYNCEDFVRVTLTPTVITQYKRTRLGRPSPGDPKVRVSKTEYSLEVSRDAVRIRKERNTDGVYPLVTNLSSKYGAARVVQVYRYQPYLEQRFQNLKSRYSVAPVYLKSPKRIVGFLHACFLALMVSALIERELRRRMVEEKVESLPIYPEERQCRAPTSPRLFELFGQVDWFRTYAGDHEAIFPANLSPLQLEVLRLLRVPKKLYGHQASD